MKWCDTYLHLETLKLQGLKYPTNHHFGFKKGILLHIHHGFTVKLLKWCNHWMNKTIYFLIPPVLGEEPSYFTFSHPCSSPPFLSTKPICLLRTKGRFRVNADILRPCGNFGDAKLGSKGSFVVHLCLCLQQFMNWCFPPHLPPAVVFLWYLVTSFQKQTHVQNGILGSQKKKKRNWI